MKDISRHLVYTAGGWTPAEATDNCLKRTKEDGAKGILTHRHRIIHSQMTCGWYGFWLFRRALWSYSIVYELDKS